WQPASQQQNPFADRCLCLDLPRDVLYQRIDARVEQMLAQGLVDEVRRLLELNRPLSQAARQALGYKEWFHHRQGKGSLEEATAEIQQRSRNFAKRQLTAFRNLSGCRMVTERLTIELWGSRMG